MVVFGFSVRSHATLTTIGTASYGGSDYNLIYDDDLSITWLDYSNARANWSDQVAWAAGLNGGGVLTYTLNAGVTTSWSGEDWRLSTMVDGIYSYGFDGSTTGGHNITTSEMGHLFYTELGNLGEYDTSGNLEAVFGLTNTGDFNNLIASIYSSGTEYSDNPIAAWQFSFNRGMQHNNTKDYEYYALAVRSGDVSVAVIPEPSTYLLLGSGIVGLIVWRRKSLLRKG